WDDDPAWVDKFRTTLKRLRATFTPHIKSNLDEPVTLGNLGLGTVRSLEAYERFSGLNFAGRTVASYARHFPFVYTSDSDLERKDVSISPTAHLFFLEEEAVVFSEEGSILSSLNTAATYVWCALKENLNQEEIIQGLTRICEIDPGSAKRQYQSLLSHFDGLGFLSQPASDHLIESESTDEPEQRRVSKGIERAWYRKRSYRLFGSCFLICFSTDEAENWGHAPLAHLELNEHCNPDFVIRLINTDVGYALYVDDVWIIEVDHINKIIPQLKFSLMRSAIHNYDYSLHLHAGAISNGKLGLILPGQKGSGKTTLVSSLLARGYSYLSDEVVLLDRGDCAVRPFPISLCVKSPGVELLSSIYPELVNLPVYQREDGEAVRYLLPPASARSENIKTPIRYMVFPRYRADAKTALYPIKRVDALKRLLDDCQSIPKPLTLDDVRDIIEWLKTVECYELPHSDLEQASGCLEGLLSLDA
ncbi:MAG: hypothetical protein OQL20_12965, partial [Sedimenticola sp.]|nr:hypothetical protein [Sedimenticola sp.]